MQNYNGPQTVSGTRLSHLHRPKVSGTDFTTAQVQQAGPNSVLTLGPSITLSAQSNTLDFYGTQILNQGTIVENRHRPRYMRETSTLNLAVYAGDIFTNTGSIDVGAGTVNLNGDWHNGVVGSST